VTVFCRGGIKGFSPPQKKSLSVSFAYRNMGVFKERFLRHTGKNSFSSGSYALVDIEETNNFIRHCYHFIIAIANVDVAAKILAMAAKQTILFNS